MTKKHAIFLLILICLLLCSCNKESDDLEKLNESRWNNLSLEYYFLEEVFLEKKIADSWYEVARIYNTLEVALIISPKSSQHWVFPLEHEGTIEVESPLEQVMLVQGSYRLVINLYQDGNSEPVCVEFNIVKWWGHCEIVICFLLV